MMVSASNVRKLRGSSRFELCLTTRMRVGSDETTVHLLDISLSGALLVASGVPAVGSRIQLRLLGRMRAAHVVRRDGRQFGIEFVAPLTAAEVASLVEAQQALAA